jgi:hypothetical protein
MGAEGPDNKVHHYIKGDGIHEPHAVVMFLHDEQQLDISPSDVNVDDMKTNGTPISCGHLLNDGDILSIGAMEF